jgi:hypothetical protein
MSVSRDRETARVEGTPRARREYIVTPPRVHVKDTSLLTSTTIILDYMAYEPQPSAKILSQVEDELVQHEFFLPPQNIHVTVT